MGSIRVRSRLSKERQTGNKGRTQKYGVGVGLEEAHVNLLYERASYR
jgi:hypothetical protein